MAAISSVSELLNLQTGGGATAPENLWFYKSNRIAGTADTTPTAGRWLSMWRYDGIPAGGSAPGAVAAPTSATQGALPFTAPSGGREKWIVGGLHTGLAAGTLFLYDRLLHISGLSGIVTTAQTVGGSLTRNTGGLGNQIWAEIYTAVGTTARTITASYTNETGTSGRTTPATTFGGTNFRNSSTMIPLPLQAGDKGVQSVQSVTLSGSTTTAGDFGVTVLRPLLMMPSTTPGQATWQSFLDATNLPELETDMCLALALQPVSTANLEQWLTFATVEV